MTLTDAILSLHPSAVFGVDFVVGQTLVDGKIGSEAVLAWNAASLGPRDDAAIAAAVAAGPSKASLLAYAAAARYAKEVGGVTVGGALIATDDRSKTLIMGARDAAKDDPNYTTPFKGADGSWSTMNATQIIAVAAALLAHVAACFAQESSLASDIGSGIVTTFSAIDAAFAAQAA